MPAPSPINGDPASSKRRAPGDASSGIDFDDTTRWELKRQVVLLDSAQDPGLTPDTINAIVEASNAQIAEGRRIQIFGGSVANPDRPESAYPPVVGYARNFLAKLVGGKPALGADLYLDRQQADAIADSNRLEVALTNKPGKPGCRVNSVSFCRKDGASTTANYAKSRRPGLVACYARDAPGTSRQEKERQAMISYMGLHQCTPAEARRGMAAEAEAKKRGTTVPAKPTPPKPPTSAELVAFATEKCITDPAKARRRFMADRAKGLV